MANRKIHLDFALYLIFIFCITYIFTSRTIFLHSERPHEHHPPSKTALSSCNFHPCFISKQTRNWPELHLEELNIDPLDEAFAGVSFRGSLLLNNLTRNNDPLDEALAGASSTTNKTVIIAVVNKAYVEGDKAMLDLFLDGFWVGEGTRELVDHLLIVAMDRTSYERCEFLRLHCYKLETEGVDFGGEKVYMSEDFIKMMWRRTLFLGEVLRRGYSFIFTDIDVLWLRNPFSYLINEEAESLDLQISTDKFIVNIKPELHPINTGFYMIRSNNKTIALFETWFANNVNSSKEKEQDVLQNLMRRGLFKRLDLKVKYLDTTYFSGFCRDSGDVAAVATVHANCCRSVAAKLADLTVVLHDWKRYRDASNNLTTPFRWSLHRACRKSWKD